MEKKRSLEDELNRLEEIVKKLEGEELPLEKSLELFEEGAALVQSAQAKLSRSEARVRQIIEKLEGSPKLEDIDIE
jgi:exodeoxyribonuclease VII small subunit